MDKSHAGKEGDLSPLRTSPPATGPAPALSPRASCRLRPCTEASARSAPPARGAPSPHLIDAQSSLCPRCTHTCPAPDAVVASRDSLSSHFGLLCIFLTNFSVVCLPQWTPNSIRWRHFWVCSPDAPETCQVKHLRNVCRMASDLQPRGEGNGGSQAGKLTSPGGKGVAGLGHGGLGWRQQVAGCSTLEPSPGAVRGFRKERRL